jgi:hypothetical protein
MIKQKNKQLSIKYDTDFIKVIDKILYTLKSSESLSGMSRTEFIRYLTKYGFLILSMENLHTKLINSEQTMKNVIMMVESPTFTRQLSIIKSENGI